MSKTVKFRRFPHTLSQARVVLAFPRRQRTEIFTWGVAKVAQVHHRTIWGVLRKLSVDNVIVAEALGDYRYRVSYVDLDAWRRDYVKVAKAILGQEIPRASKRRRTRAA